MFFHGFLPLNILPTSGFSWSAICPDFTVMLFGMLQHAGERAVIRANRAKASAASPVASTFQASQGRECDKARRNHRKGLKNFGNCQSLKKPWLIYVCYSWYVLDVIHFYFYFWFMLVRDKYYIDLGRVHKAEVLDFGDENHVWDCSFLVFSTHASHRHLQSHITQGPKSQANL